MLRKIVVLYNLQTGDENIKEADGDTRRSAGGVAKALDSLGYEAELFGVSEPTMYKVLKLKADLVFNLVEWSGRNSLLGVQILQILEKSGLKFTGSGSWGYGLSCNKILVKEYLDMHGIPTPRWKVLDGSDVSLNGFKYPLIVKPVYEHCGIGVSQSSVCENAKCLMLKAQELINTYKQPVLVEEFIDGDELHVTVLEKKGKPWVLPPARIAYQKKRDYWPLLTYESKWQDGNWENELSEISESKITDEIEKAAVSCYKNLGGRNYPRYDMRVDNSGKVYVLDVNNNPGIDFDPESGITVSAEASGLNFDKLIANIVKEAYDSPLF